MVDITTVGINISDLGVAFGILEIATEISKEINHSGTFVILHKSGTPVSDCSATRGKYFTSNYAPFFFIRITTISILRLKFLKILISIL